MAYIKTKWSVRISNRSILISLITTSVRISKRSCDDEDHSPVSIGMLSKLLPFTMNGNEREDLGNWDILTDARIDGKKLSHSIPYKLKALYSD